MTECSHRLVVYDADYSMTTEGRAVAFQRCLLCGLAYDRRGFLARLQRRIKDRWRMRTLAERPDD